MVTLPYLFFLWQIKDIKCINKIQYFVIKAEKSNLKAES